MLSILILVFTDRCLFPSQGRCKTNEICVNGPLDSQRRPTVAKCIEQKGFQPLSYYLTPDGKERMQQSLAGSTASALISQANRQTVMSVASLEMDAGVIGGRGGSTSQTNCTDCAEVTTGKLGEGTDFLSTEITMNMAGTAAAAGILWLAIMSG